MNRFDRFVLVEFALDAEFCVADGDAARAKREDGISRLDSVHLDSKLGEPRGIDGKMMRQEVLKTVDE